MEINELNEINNQMFFALDIGTRSIMGVLGRVENDQLIIKHVAVEYHRRRAMYDGQIHDIEAVTNAARKVKDRLEEESGLKLKEVAVAAAGRSLKTIHTIVTKELDPEVPVDAYVMKTIEAEGLQEAANLLKEGLTEHIPYFNVGHTVMTYKLDELDIKNPDGHKGEILSLEIIATFLPKMVVEALNTVMNKIGLKVSYISLEPIVAMEVSVPENVRLLNIAMVDIGAGTSDIAIAENGIITGYAMTSTAGDEITEALSRTYLLDFDTAEKLKCNLCQEDHQTFNDIVGNKYEKTSDEILDELQPTIDVIGVNIAKAILETNEKAPSAVFMIGGGSQIPRLKDIVAKELDIDPHRVAVKSVENISNIVNESPLLTGPVSVTPVGILASAIKSQKNNFMHVKVNDAIVQLFRSTELRVSDALILAGFNPKDLIPRKGKSIIITVNGDKKVINGKFGDEAKITINGEKGNLDSKISDGDNITIQPAVVGEDAKITLKELQEREGSIMLNSNPLNLAYDLKLNNNFENNLDLILSDDDSVSYELLETVEELKYYINADEGTNIYINSMFVTDDTLLKNGDIVTTKQMTIQERQNRSQVKKVPNTSVEHEEIDENEKEIMVVVNSQPIKMKKKNSDIIFVDIFDYIDFDRSKVNGKLIVKHNGQKADYTTTLQNNDKIEIYWEKEVDE